MPGAPAAMCRSITAGTSDQVATNLETAINGSTLDLTATISSGNIDNLTFNANGVEGNATTITPTIHNGTAAVTATAGLSLGAGDNCTTGTACKVNDDCQSHSCSSGSCL